MSARPSVYALAAIGHKHFGNPIPQEWYAAARELLSDGEPACEPTAKFEDPNVQTVYEILCAQEKPPEGEHWEGFLARRIVDALRDQMVQGEPKAWLYPGDPSFDGKNWQERVEVTTSYQVAEFKCGTIEKPVPLHAKGAPS